MSYRIAAECQVKSEAMREDQIKMARLARYRWHVTAVAVVALAICGPWGISLGSSERLVALETGRLVLAWPNAGNATTNVRLNWPDGFSAAIGWYTEAYPDILTFGFVDSGGGTIFFLPLLPVAVVLGLFAAAFWALPRFPPWTCQRCGYDVRGSTGKRCSECGLPYGSRRGHGHPE